jgi:hypothetical protein
MDKLSDTAKLVHGLNERVVWGTVVESLLLALVVGRVWFAIA